MRNSAGNISSILIALGVFAFGYLWGAARPSEHAPQSDQSADHSARTVAAGRELKPMSRADVSELKRSPEPLELTTELTTAERYSLMGVNGDDLLNNLGITGDPDSLVQFESSASRLYLNWVQSTQQAPQ